MAKPINFTNSEKLAIYKLWCDTKCSMNKVASEFSISVFTARYIINKECEKDKLKAELIRLGYWNHKYTIEDSNRIAIIKKELKDLGVTIL